MIWPIFESFWLSFFDWDGLGQKEWIGTANYVELFDDDAFYTSLKNNVIWLLLYLLAVPAGLVHRDLSQPERDRHPDLQIALLLSLRDQPGGRRA